MKIDRLETINLRFEYARGFTYAGGACTGRLSTVVLVHTQCGRVGIGSAYTHPGLAYLVIQEQLQPILQGKDPRDVETLWGQMYRLTRWYGRKGAAMSALGAIDTALWDLRGQAEGKPVWRLLGGQSNRCEAYGSALLWKDFDALAEEAATLLERGFRRVKMRLGRGPEYDEPAVSAVRRAIGGRCDLMVDGSMRYSPQRALELSAHLKRENVFWFEEPFEPEALSLYADLRSQCEVPLAAGENEFGLQGFREVIQNRAVDIVQPDASRCGGISEARQIARLAEQCDLKFATHSWSDAIAIIANAHVVAAFDNGLTVEIDQSGNPFVDALTVEPLRITDGRLELTDQPGLGVELNWDVIEQHRMSDPIHMPAGVYSDMMFFDAD